MYHSGGRALFRLGVIPTYQTDANSEYPEVPSMGDTRRVLTSVEKETTQTAS